MDFVQHALQDCPEILSSPLRKNADYFELNSKYGYQLDKKGTIFVGGLLSFNSQFTEGYKEGETKYSSNFLAPGNLIIAAGIDWKPNSDFSLFFSPLASKMTFVLDNGVDETAYGLLAGKKMKMELGAYLKSEYKKTLMKNVNFKTGLVLYTNYLDTTKTAFYDKDENLTYKSNLGNIDVDWFTGLDLIVNKWITVNLGTQLIYDHDITITGVDSKGNAFSGPRTQFKEALNVGFTYKFVPKTKEVK